MKPVLDTCFSPDGSTVFSCGADAAVRMWQLGGAATAQQIGSHEGPIKCVGFASRLNMVVTAGWDRKVRDGRRVLVNGILPSTGAQDCKFVHLSHLPYSFPF